MLSGPSPGVLLLLAIMLAAESGPASGQTWQLLPLPEGATSIKRMAVGDQSVIVATLDAGGAGHGIFRRSFDETAEWEALGAAGFSIRELSVSGSHDDEILAACDSPPYLIYRGASDSTWVARNAGISEMPVYRVLAGYPYPGRTYLSVSAGGGYNGTVVSSDFGESWTVSLLDPNWGAFRDLAAKPGTPDQCWAVSIGGFFNLIAWRTTDGGATWINVPSGWLGSLEPRDLAVYPYRDNSFVVVAGSEGGTLLHWENGTYQPGSSSGPGGGFDAFGAQIPTWDADMVYLAGRVPAGHLAVYRADLQPGGVWEQVGAGLEGSVCPSPSPWWQNEQRFQFGSARGAPRLFVLQREAGLWTIELPGVTAVSEETPAASDWCSPARPGVSSSLVRWTLAVSAEEIAAARILDVRGREVATASIRSLGRTAELSWDGRTAPGTRAPSGVYFLRVSTTQAGEATRRFLRVR